MNRHDRILRAIVGMLERFDPHALDAHVDERTVVWHNDDGVDIAAVEAFAGVGRLEALVDGLRVDVIRTVVVDDGFVVRLELRGTVRSTGQPLRARNAMFVTVVEDVIRRIDEYVDPTFATQLGLERA